MRLFLVRHAIAEEKAANDGWRMLTAKGRKRFKRVAGAFGRTERVDLILTSPLVRALQTAEILAGEVEYGAMRVLPELASGCAADEMLKAAAKAAGKAGSVALVGHDPQLTEALAALAKAPAGRLDFRKGVIVCLEVGALAQPKTVAVRWWLKPKSGAMKMGLPVKGDEKPAKAAPEAAKARAPKKAAPAAKKRAAPRAPKEVGRSPQKTAPAEAAPQPSEAQPVSPPPAAPARQTFMGSPRPAAEPPPAAPEES